MAYFDDEQIKHIWEYIEQKDYTAESLLNEGFRYAFIKDFKDAIWREAMNDPHLSAFNAERMAFIEIATSSMVDDLNSISDP